MRGSTLLWSLLALIAAAILLRPAFTPSIRTEQGVAALEQQTLGGRAQWVLTRGQDRGQPLLLFLHGGPGMSAMYLAHASTRRLEQDFVVVHWDRRDAGKSFDPSLSPEEEKVSVQLRDAEQLIGLLRQRFGGRRVVLVGHSWGTYLGVLLARDHPDWFAAYIGVGQVTSPSQQRVAADRFLYAEAERRGNAEALRDLRTQPDATREKWLFAFGGELYGSTSFLPLVLTGLLAPEYTFWDALRVPRGPEFAARHMQYDVLAEPLSDAVAALELPVFLAAGRRDYNTPSELGVAWLDRLRAPCKQLFWFERSAHFPFYEEPERFADVLRQIRGTPCVAERL